MIIDFENKSQIHKSL